MEVLHQLHCCCNDCTKPSMILPEWWTRKRLQRRDLAQCPVFLVITDLWPPLDCIRAFRIHSHCESETLRARPGKCIFYKMPNNVFYLFVANIYRTCHSVQNKIEICKWKKKGGFSARFALVLFVFLALLRHNWHISLRRLKMYNGMVWGILWNDYHNSVS